MMFDALDACFQVQLMAGMWIPVVWLLTFHFILEPPWIDTVRAHEISEVGSDDGDDTSGAASDDESDDSDYA